MPAVNPCGARPADWDAVIAAGLTACTLPVVQNPQVPRSASSALKALGKVPSRKNGYGEAVGFPGWTTHVTTPEEIAQWRQDQDLGISIRLEHMIAVDCDVDDAEIAPRNLQDPLRLDRRGASQAHARRLRPLAGRHASG